MVRYCAHDLALHVIVVPVSHVLNDVRAEVGGHHNDRVAKVDCATLAIGQSTIIQHLKQDIEDIRVRLFNFV